MQSSLSPDVDHCSHPHPAVDGQTLATGYAGSSAALVRRRPATSHLILSPSAEAEPADRRTLSPEAARHGRTRAAGRRLASHRDADIADAALEAKEVPDAIDRAVADRLGSGKGREGDGGRIGPGSPQPRAANLRAGRALPQAVARLGLLLSSGSTRDKKRLRLASALQSAC